MAITDRVQRDTLERDGVVCLRGVFDQRWLDMIGTGIAASLSEPGPYFWNYQDDSEGRHFHNENRRWPAIRDYRCYIFESPVAEIVAELTQWTQLSLLHESVFVRMGGTNLRTPWHTDIPYLPVDGVDAMCSAWMPLDPVRKSYSLDYVRGSHRWVGEFNRTSFDPACEDGYGADDPDAWDQLPDIDADPSNYDIVSYELDPGDCLVFYGTTVHGSTSNMADVSRLRVFTTRFLSPAAIFRPDKPGGTQPDYSEFANACGLKPGDKVTSELFPQVWPR